MRSVPLGEFGVEWIQPPAPLAHPLDNGPAVVLERSLEETAAGLDGDAGAWRRLFGPFVSAAEELIEGTLAGPRLPRHPIHMARFGLSALRSAAGLARSRFAGERARALFAGNAAHAMLPLESAATASFGLVLAMLGHAVGWPLPARRLAGPRGRPRVLPPVARRRDRDGPHGDLAGRGAGGRNRSARRDSEAVPGTGRRRGTVSLPAGAREVPLRARRREGRLCARRARAMAIARAVRARRPCISAARSARSQSRRPRSRGAGSRPAPTCSSLSRASSTSPARRQASTRCGRTRTCRTDRR